MGRLPRGERAHGRGLPELSRLHRVGSAARGPPPQAETWPAVNFWYVIETKPKAKHRHLHEAVAISEQERAHLRRALLVASNTKGEFRKFAVRTKQVTYGFGIAGYARKALSRTTLEFPGRNVTATTH